MRFFAVPVRVGVVAVSLQLLVQQLQPAAASWMGALEVVDISPSAEQLATNAVFLGGYGALGFRDGATLGFARGVADPIHARALYLEDALGEAMAIVVIDATGIGNVVRDEIRRGVTAATGLALNSVLVAATHTHCGPDLQGMWGGVHESYRVTVVQGAVVAVTNAVRNKRSVELQASQRATGDALTRNRRGWGFTENSTAVLTLRATDDDELLGVLMNFAAHPTTLGRSVLDASADFGGYVCRHVEQAIGAPAMWVNGALGDVSAVGQGGEGFERPALYGEMLGREVMLAIRGPQTTVRDRLSVHATVYEQEVTNLALVAAFALGVLDGYITRVEGRENFIVETIATHIRLGDEVQAVSTPGESLTRNAQPILEAMSAHADVAMVLGLTQDSLGYFVPEDEWEQSPSGSDYEEGVAVNRDAGDRLRDILLQLVDPTRGNATQPRHRAASPLHGSGVRFKNNNSRGSAIVRGTDGRALSMAQVGVRLTRLGLSTAAVNGLLYGD